MTRQEAKLAWQKAYAEQLKHRQDRMYAAIRRIMSEMPVMAMSPMSPMSLDDLTALHMDYVVTDMQQAERVTIDRFNQLHDNTLYDL